MNATRIIQLASRIQQRTADIDDYLQRNGLPTPSFDEDGPVDLGLSGDLVTAREEALASILELQNLLLGPTLCLLPVYNGVGLQVIYRYDVARHVPIHGEIAFSELAAICRLDEVNLRRSLRFAMAYHHIFREPRKGYVAHTAASRKLVDDPHASAGLGYVFEEVWQAFAHTLPALDQHQSDAPGRSGWSHYHNTDMPPWEYYAAHPEMARRFAGAMSFLAAGHGNSPSHLVQGYPWDTLGSGTIVDVGGSKGNISTLLAQKYRRLKFIVQDLPSMIQGVAETLPDDVRDRVEFQAYDFFTTQPVQADVYLFRNIFHNWSDSHATRILQALVPALRPGARIVVNDYLLPEPGTMSLIKERAVREMDMTMFSLFNAREREEADWIELLSKADPRFADVRVWTQMAVWKP
ncbi:O-methyltransferas-like protein [Aspergillus sclerotioniger CBS 115572]|uniref:O-methyltransferas-like protein n=1 Tax=Aspergillus sclerotioniger CBS 115572 TaxID=1450535 RepID=A0A317WL20_9EURO|nr:O-methyltransferas-like protein [Aspergillus sclerotioniger CBS 115572]PWY87083.1 O-methyltransferas-like protein [Aspergillus sclerotioniger CBS 115572]